MMAPDDITALILAGGESTRFGTDKAQHVVGGRAMIARVAGAVRAVAQEVLVSVAEEGVVLPGLPPGVRYVADHYRGAGPLAGLHAGLKAARTPWVLAVACDMPFVTPAVLRRLIEARAPDVAAVVARTPDGRSHPLCACYHAYTLPVAEAQLEAGHRAIHTFLTLMQVRYLVLPAAPLRNINRPSDLDSDAGG